MVMEIFSIMMLKDENEGVFKSFTVRGTRAFSHIIFVDDIPCFLLEKEENIKNLKTILDDFGDLMGLQINLQKTHVFFSKSCGGRG